MGREHDTASDAPWQLYAAGLAGEVERDEQALGGVLAQIDEDVGRRVEQAIATCG